MITVPAGTTISVRETFLDEYGIPLVPNASPTVSLVDMDQATAFFGYASQDQIPGKWVSDISVPLFDNKDCLEFSIIWLFDTGRLKYKSTENIIVEPSVQDRESEAVAIFGDPNFVVNIHYLIDKNSNLMCDMFTNNTPLYSLPVSDSSITLHQNRLTTNISLPLTVANASVYPSTLLLRYTKPEYMIPETMTYKVWVCTPQMLNAASQLENFVNKSRISNVIPELRYAQSDLMLALSRGLEMFNSLGPALSAFDGTNMQGYLLDSWVICSCINLLNMQYMAEGSLAFDFSGQSVSLNIDRTQYIDSILSKLDSMVENQVKPVKRLLARNGVMSGSGAVGSQSMNSNFGITTLTLSPTTRFFNGSLRNFKRYW